ncbi:CTD small phosphatase-like protein 2-A [Sinocyclocheilus rhinocerous]|uniref:CTD small phosphatase-like protein 2-A n=1 Tax=Sinocyclocheilus rhinocerous TaxID=307959 RepID=UPI0007B95D38|nr:PREDICTED: CTD small phosphatase-like protein 2-A [Sinocyclocheilus rhinocerous]
MRLRSRNILNENPTTPSRRRRRAAPETPGPQTPQVQTQDEVKVLQDCLNLDADEVPTVAKRPRRRRKPLSTVDNKESDFKTPVRHLRERHSSLNPAARSLYSPTVHFLTPPRDSQYADETLVFSSLNVIHDAEYTFNTHFQDHKYKVYVILRPYVKEFLQAMTKHFEMFVYTSAKKEYAEKIVDILDPNKKLFRHRLYQDDCACVLGHYIKDLTVLERDLSKTVILDNAPHTFPYHLMNMIPIKSWVGDQEDRELQKLIPYMEKLVHADDIRNVLKKRTDHFHRLLSED